MRSFIFLLCLGCAVSLARSQSSHHLSKPSSLKAVFDQSSNKLPPYFQGDDANILYRAIAQKLVHPDKGEFESSAEYESRLQVFASQPILGKTAAGDEFAFVLGLGGESVRDADATVYGKIQTSYDADAQMLTVTIPLDPLSDQDGNFFDWASIWKRDGVPLGSYIGSNAFGVKAQVRRFNDLSTEILIANSDWLQSDCSKNPGDVTCSVSLGSSIARSFAAHPRVLVIGELLPPFISSQEDTCEPTVDAPSEIHHHYKLLHFRLDQLWLFDGETGAVLRKYSREIHAVQFPLAVSFVLGTPKTWKNPHCADVYVPQTPVVFNYGIDGSDPKTGILSGTKVLEVDAHRSVAGSAQYCDLDRISLTVNGKPFTLICETQTEFPFSASKCDPIQLKDVRP
jgi:hypothetical protein